jgi:type I restriction enzyme S subunit
VTKWNTARLGDLCDFRGGLWTGKKPPFIKVKVIRNTNFTKRHTLDLSDVAEIDVEESQLAKRTLNQDDIILEKSGGGPKQPVGRVVLFRENASEAYSFSNFTTAMRVRDKSRLSPFFLHWFLLHFYESGQTVAMQSNSTGLRNLSLDSYKKIEVPIPPITEQDRIVDILDKSSEHIARATFIAKRNITNAGEFQKPKTKRQSHHQSSACCKRCNIFVQI